MVGICRPASQCTRVHIERNGLSRWLSTNTSGPTGVEAQMATMRSVVQGTGSVGTVGQITTFSTRRKVTYYDRHMSSYI